MKCKMLRDEEEFSNSKWTYFVILICLLVYSRLFLLYISHITAMANTKFWACPVNSFTERVKNDQK